MARCTELALFGVLALLALSLQGCGESEDCPEACGEYSQGDTSVVKTRRLVTSDEGDTVANEKDEKVCMETSDVTGGLAVCSPEGYCYDNLHKLIGTHIVCKQISKDADPSTNYPPSSYKKWDELTDEEKAAALALGANASMWNNDIPPPTDDIDWDDLTPEQRAAAATLGWTNATWSSDIMTKYAQHDAPGHLMSIMGVSFCLSMFVVLAVSIRVAVKRRNQRNATHEQLELIPGSELGEAEENGLAADIPE
jgi:hypothetical protein